MQLAPQNFISALQSVTTLGVYMGWKEAKNKTYLTGSYNYEIGELKDVDIIAKLPWLKFICIKKLLDSAYHHPWKVVVL